MHIPEYICNQPKKKAQDDLLEKTFIETDNDNKVPIRFARDQQGRTNGSGLTRRSMYCCRGW